MSIVTKKETSNKKKLIKFRTLVISVNIILVLVFQSVYINANMQRLKDYAYNAEIESLQTYHSYLSESFSTCMYEVDMLRSFIERNKLSGYVNQYLNLIDASEAASITEETRKTVQQLSVSDTIIRDFIILGENFNQKNLYCGVETRELKDTLLPSIDLLEKTGLDGVLHTNLGYIVKCTDEQLEMVKKQSVTGQDREATDNMIQYLKDEYIVCDYISGSLTIIRLNKSYMEGRFQMEGDDKFVVYHTSERPILYFNTDEEYANTLLKQVEMDTDYYETDECRYSISPNLYGKINVVTEREKSNTFFSFTQSGLMYLIFTGISVLVSLLFLFLFSNKVFHKLSFLHTTIKKQTKSQHFDLMEMEEKQGWLRKMTFSKRILLTFIGSCLVSLVLVSVVFHVLVEWETRNLAEALGEQLSKNYSNECMVHYERYNSLSTVKIEKFLEEFKKDDENGNVELTREFEENFYYETTHLPGYSYAFIVDGNDEVIYQTIFSSQKQVPSVLIRNVLAEAEKMEDFESDGVFVPINDLISGEQVLAFTKQVNYQNGNHGAIIIVSDEPEKPINDINRTIMTEFLIVDGENEVLIGDASRYNPNYINTGKMFDADNKILYSMDTSAEACLGNAVVLTYYNFYLNQIREIQYINLVWTLFIACICIVATFLLRRVFVKPFNILIMSMNATPESGYQSISENFAIDEINTIAIAYNKMMNRLENLVDESVRKEAERRELELLQAQTEFKMLEQQINPHFLFNTLECVNLLAIKSGEESISGIVKSLSMILRYAISKETKVMVGREIKVLQSYIEIQRFRFRERFQIELHCDESLYELYMIKFVLQPILENAILHGMSQTTKGGKIQITLGCYDEGIEFRIKDNGVGMSQEALERLGVTLRCGDDDMETRKDGGIGLRNVYRRIELYYKGKGDFIVNSMEGEGTEVIVRLPFDLGDGI